MREAADLLVSSGLAKLGYVFLNVDDCWAALNRTTAGTVQADPVSFPSGMKALADYAHSKQLYFGLYSDAGTETCQGRPGSLGYERNDVDSYVSWGVNYLKYDNCHNQNLPAIARYQRMADVLNALPADQSLFWSLCEWGREDPATWAPSMGGNSWRTTVDIKAVWQSIVHNIHLNDQWAKYAGPHHWNDPDMLEVGVGHLTEEQERTHFSLWCIAKAPLLIGADLANIRPSSFAILGNTEAIAVNQDPLGVQGTRVQVNSDHTEVWSGPLEDGSFAVVLVNLGVVPQSITLDLSAFGAGPFQIRDLWQHTLVASHYTATTFTVKGVKKDDCRFLRISRT